MFGPFHSLTFYFFFLFYFFLYITLTLVARSISDDLSSGDAARFRDDEYGKSDSASGMGSSSGARNESAHKGERDKEKKEKDKEDFEGMRMKKGRNLNFFAKKNNFSSLPFFRNN